MKSASRWVSEWVWRCPARGSGTGRIGPEDIAQNATRDARTAMAMSHRKVSTRRGGGGGVDFLVIIVLLRDGCTA